MIDYVESFRTRFLSIDRQNPLELACKKKRDIRKLVFSGTNEQKKAALEIVWAEELKAGKV